MQRNHVPNTHCPGVRPHSDSTESNASTLRPTFLQGGLSMAGRIRGWLRLTGSQRTDLVAMVLALPLIEAALRLFDYQ